MADQKRPHVPHSLSGLLRFHRRETIGDERQALLGSSASPRNSLAAPNITVSEPEASESPGIEINEDEDVEDEDAEHADSDGLYPPHSCWTAAQGLTKVARDRADPFRTRECRVYVNIHRIRRDIINSIDDPYTLDQLKAPRMNVSVIRPLVQAYYKCQDLSIIYCLLVNRMQFNREKTSQTHHQTVNLTRALLCEIVAERVLRRYNDNNAGPKGLLKLATILVQGFEAFQNAPKEVIEDAQYGHAMNWMVRETALSINEGKLTALEVAIVSEAKSFLASSACQKVVDAIYRGKVVYSPNSFIDIIPDRWKKRPISLYDPRRGPLLNQHRLIVPRTRNFMEICHFLILLSLYIATMVQRETRFTTSYEPIEAVFDVYAAGWALDQFASVLEHGWQVYTQNLWAFLDQMFTALFLVYLVMRLHALRLTDEEEAKVLARTALDVLCCAAPVLIPRLAFNVMSENLLFVSLRAMMSDFLTLTALAVWSFAGFLLSLKWLHNGVHESITISKWMVWIWFGLDGTGIDEAPDFHWFLGPALMVTFAFLGNTLFLTILVSMLSNTFGIIVKNAVSEIQFRRAVLTFEGVKSDAIFAYMPPFNILALLIMLPLKSVLSPRMFHKVNVGVVRVINFPVLMIITLFERQTLWVSEKNIHNRAKIAFKNPFSPRKTVKGWWYRTLSFWDFSRFSVHGDIAAVFDIDPPQSVLDEISKGDENDEGIGKIVNQDFHNQFGADSFDGGNSRNPSRNPSTAPSIPPGAGLSSRKPRERRKSGLSQEFADSSSGSDAEDEADHPKGYKKVKKAERVDSMMDMSDGNVDMAEANARLHKMEQAMERMEALMERMAGHRHRDRRPSDGDEDDGRAEEDVLDAMQTNAP